MCEPTQSEAWAILTTCAFMVIGVWLANILMCKTVQQLNNIFISVWSIHIFGVWQKILPFVAHCYMAPSQVNITPWISTQQVPPIHVSWDIYCINNVTMSITIQNIKHEEQVYTCAMSLYMPTPTYCECTSVMQIASIAHVFYKNTQVLSENIWSCIF